ALAHQGPLLRRAVLRLGEGQPAGLASDVDSAESHPTRLAVQAVAETPVAAAVLVHFHVEVAVDTEAPLRPAFSRAAIPIAVARSRRTVLSLRTLSGACTPSSLMSSGSHPTAR